MLQMPKALWNPKNTKFTCENRCGQKPKHVIPSTRECSCDALCFINRDCCRDMRKLCPETYLQGKNVYSHLEGSEAECLHTPFYLIFHKNEIVSTAPTLIPSTFTPMTSTDAAPKMNHRVRNRKPPAGFHRVMREYCTVLSEFRVADITFGVLFQNYAAFHSWRVPSSVPYFVPKVTTLVCPRNSPKPFKYAEASEYLSSCSVHLLTDVLTGLERSCSPLDVIFCRCGDSGEIIGDIRRESCQGQYNDMSIFKRNNSFEHMLYLTNYLPREGCEFTSYFFNKGASGPMVNSLSDEEQTLQMSIKPFLTTEGSPFELDGEEEKSDDAEFEFLFGRERIDYVVELSEGIERRFTCPSLQVSLSECRLEQCADGAILALNPSMPQQYGGRHCTMPAVVHILGLGYDPTVPVCACMRAMAALSVIWQVTKNQEVTMHCLLQLEMTPGSRSISNRLI